jgi:hypothetical protein
MKKFYVFMMALAMGLSFTSCGDDNDDKDTICINPGSTQVYSGTMTVTYEGEDYATDNTIVSMTGEEGGKTVKLLFNKVKFVPQMPVSLDIVVPGVKAVAENGGLSLSGDGIVPLAMNRTFEMYSVKGLSGTVKDGKMTLSLSFGSFPVTYKGTLAE